MELEVSVQFVSKTPTKKSEKGKTLDELYTCHNIIGKGAFSKVYVATPNDPNAEIKKVAIKMINKKEVKDYELRVLYREIDIMGKLDHPHIAKLYQVFETDDIIALVLEYIPGGELFDAIIEKGVFTEIEAIAVIRQLLDAISYLHSNGVAHRDLKPENLLLQKKEWPFFLKLVDFGLASNFNETKLSTFVGTPDYVAPEILDETKSEYSAAVDIWSIGVITYILLVGSFPFPDQNPLQKYKRIQSGEYDKRFLECSDQAKNFISRLLVPDPEKRASIEECLEHPWLSTSISGSNQTFSAKKLSEYRDTYKKTNQKK